MVSDKPWIIRGEAHSHTSKRSKVGNHYEIPLSCLTSSWVKLNEEIREDATFKIGPLPATAVIKDKDNEEMYVIYNAGHGKHNEPLHELMEYGVTHKAWREYYDKANDKGKV